MAIHFLPPEQSGLAGTLGLLAGGGLGSLGNYINDQIQMPKKIEQFKLLGASPEQAQALSQLPPEMQSAWLKESMKGQRLAQQGQLLSGLAGGAGMPALQSLGAPGELPKAPEAEGAQAVPPQFGGGRSVEDLQAYRARVLASGADPALVKDAVALIDREIDQKLKQESAARKERFEEKKFSAAEQREINKETKPYYEKINNEGKEAQKSEMRLDRMEELIKKGNIRHPFWNSLFNTVSHGIFGIGIDLNFLQNADTQEFKKLSQDFLKGVKNYFGSRVTQQEVQLFLETIPSLSQTDEGKMRVLNNLRVFNDAALSEKKAMQQIIKENGGKRPANLEEQVEERTAQLKDQLAQVFKQGFK